MWQLIWAMGSSSSVTYELILEPRLTYATVVWEKVIKKKTTEAVQTKMSVLVLREATGAAKLTSIPVLEAL